jgi:hypothetical protein
MKQTINLFDFRRAFQDHDRENFSYDGLNILYDALITLEQDTGNETELDVIGLCCDFQELSASEVRDYYPDSTDWLSIEEFLSDNTWLCGSFNDGQDARYIFQQF